MSSVLTPSAAYGCIEFLSIIERQRLSPSQILELNIGPIPTKVIIELADVLRWAEIDSDGAFVVTEPGRNCLELVDPVAQLRYLLGDYFKTVRSPWLQLAKRGRQPVLLQAPVEITQLLYEARLASGTGDDTIKFWDDLASFLRNEKDINQLEIGRTGERLSINFETTRTGFEPKWMALESNQFGYDILTRISQSDDTPLKLETKCSLASISSANFYLTKFEWETATRSINYQFHLWSLSKNSKHLAVLTGSDMTPHIPTDQNEGSWGDVEIPFSIFSNLFSAVNL